MSLNCGNAHLQCYVETATKFSTSYSVLLLELDSSDYYHRLVLCFHHFALCPLMTPTGAGGQSPMCSYESRPRCPASTVSGVPPRRSSSVGHIRRWAPPAKRSCGRLRPVLLQDGGMRSGKHGPRCCNESFWHRRTTGPSLRL